MVSIGELIGEFKISILKWRFSKIHKIHIRFCLIKYYSEVFYKRLFYLKFKLHVFKSFEVKIEVFERFLGMALGRGTIGPNVGF